MPLVDVMMGLGTVGNIALYAAQLPMARQMLKERSAAAFSWAPSLAMLAPCVLWTLYAAMYQPEAQLIAINTVGAAAALGYLALFAALTPPGRGRLAIGASAAAVIVSCLAFFGALALARVSNPAPAGVVTVVVNAGLWISPLIALRSALEHLDVSHVSGLLTGVEVALCVVWLVVGIMLRDPYIIANCVVGEVFSLLQAAIFLRIRLLLKHPHAAVLEPAGQAGLVADGGEAGASAAPPSPPPWKSPPPLSFGLLFAHLPHLHFTHLHYLRPTARSGIGKGLNRVVVESGLETGTGGGAPVSKPDEAWGVAAVRAAEPPAASTRADASTRAAPNLGAVGGAAAAPHRRDRGMDEKGDASLLASSG